MLLTADLTKPIHIPNVKTAKELLGLLRSYLIDRVKHGQLKLEQPEIYRFTKIIADGNGKNIAIIGGEKTFKRERGKAQIIRDDGAWLHFTITVAEDLATDLALIAYDFELVFEEPTAPDFLRFDLNALGHSNEARGLRCHFHPGHDDLISPSPVWLPVQLLELFIEGLRFQKNGKLRSVSKRKKRKDQDG